MEWMMVALHAAIVVAAVSVVAGSWVALHR